MSENQSRQNEESGRDQPRNLQELLIFATNQIRPDGENSTANINQVTSLDGESIEQRRQWLDNVLRSMSVNVVERMKKALSILVEDDKEDEAVSRKEMALDELLEWIDDIDFANDFHKINGYSALLPLLDSPNAVIRCKTALVIFELTQNNPEGSKVALANNLLPKLLQMVDKDEDYGVRAQALSSMKAMMMSVPEDSVGRFVQLDGLSVLLRSLQCQNPKLRLKAVFCVLALISQDGLIGNAWNEMGFAEQLIGMLQHEEHSEIHEHILNAILRLTHVGKAAEFIKECRRTELGLCRILQHKLESLKGKDEFQEELEYCNDLMKVLFSEGQLEER